MIWLATMLAAQAPAQPPIVVTAPPVVRARIRNGQVSDQGYRRVLRLRRGVGGRVAVRFVVAADGRPIGCDLVDSTGDTDLDALPCQALRTFRFDPARDAAGQRVAQTWIMRWLLIPDGTMVRVETIEPDPG